MTASKIHALLTEIGVLMEDGTECLLSRTLNDTDLAVLVSKTQARVEAMQVILVAVQQQLGHHSVNRH